MKFLIADDDRRMRELIKRFLSENIPDQHTFFEASTGSDAIALFDRIIPDCVLMDIKMQAMDGLTASRMILSSHPAARVIILTSYDDPDYRAEAKKVGAYGYVTKDHLHELLALLANFRKPGEREE